MYRFDSRFMTHFDSVTRQFTDPGVYYFYMALHPEFSRSPDFSEMAKIEVSKNSETKPVQHRVAVRQGENGKLFSAQPQSLKIHKGDTIQWHKPKSSTHGYFVQVMDEKRNVVFNSQALGKHDVFTHLFTHPGVYQYTNSLGENGQRPQIKVYQVDPREQDWKQLTAKPTLIRYKDGKFHPEKAEVPEGGTVVWFIEGKDPVAIQLHCYELDDIDLSKIPRPPRGKRGCKPDKDDSGCSDKRQR